MMFYTDASGSWGCGALWGSCWLQCHWPSQWADMSIMVKELVPIVCAAAVWGPSWMGLHVLCYCDNMSVVHALNKGSSRELSGVVMHLLRTLTFFSAIFGFVLRAQHVAGLDIGPADAISRDNLSLLFSQVPNAAREPTPIPEELWTCW